MESFNLIDLQVCKVLKCSEIRKSHSCHKLTVYDGIKERTIVSSIKKILYTRPINRKKDFSSSQSRTCKNFWSN